MSSSILEQDYESRKALYFTRHEPKCLCGFLMFFTDNTHYACLLCGHRVSLLAAGTNLKKLHSKDKHRITYYP